MSDSATSAGRFNVKRLLPVAVLVAGLVAFFAFDLDEFVTLDALKTHRTVLQGWVEVAGSGGVAGLRRHLHGRGGVLGAGRVDSSPLPAASCSDPLSRPRLW